MDKRPTASKSHSYTTLWCTVMFHIIDINIWLAKNLLLSLLVKEFRKSASTFIPDTVYRFTV